MQISRIIRVSKRRSRGYAIKSPIDNKEIGSWHRRSGERIDDNESDVITLLLEMGPPKRNETRIDISPTRPQGPEGVRVGELVSSETGGGWGTGSPPY